MKMKISKKLIKVLACPKCRNGLEYIKNKQEVKCIKCNKIYKIKKGIFIFMDMKQK